MGRQLNLFVNTTTVSIYTNLLNQYYYLYGEFPYKIINLDVEGLSFSLLRPNAYPFGRIKDIVKKSFNNRKTIEDYKYLYIEEGRWTILKDGLFVRADGGYVATIVNPSLNFWKERLGLEERKYTVSFFSY